MSPSLYLAYLFLNCRYWYHVRQRGFSSSPAVPSWQ
ncbi:hypothetical protein E2C01_083095 [Portunus trituberculatus]|uniref:Uncharacterized protein n=1 Tax=Portunus trituberculatus TaxID=210409 RepID=A0A5B7J5H4_PORTR|nr:hypothetical protein [Portunus trituberculatus]